MNKNGIALIDAIVSSLTLITICVFVTNLVIIYKQLNNNAQSFFVDLLKSQSCLENIKTINFDDIKTNECLIVKEIDLNTKLICPKTNKTKIYAIKSRFK